MSITRLSGGLTPGDGSDPRTFPEIFNDVADLVEAAGSDIDTLEGKNIPAFGTATPSDGQVLTFDSGASEYVPEDVAGSLADLTDTSITSPASGEALVYDGTNWVNAAGAGGGKILQVVSTTKTDVFTTTADTYQEVPGLTATITPSSASSKVLIMAMVPAGGVAANPGRRFGISLFRDSTNLSVPDSLGSRFASMSQIMQNIEGDQPGFQILATASNFVDAPATTGSITYSVRVRNGVSGDTIRVNDSGTSANAASLSRTVATITLMEVAV